MIPWQLAPRMKDDVRRKPQRLEISSFYAETISVYQNTLVSMKMNMSPIWQIFGRIPKIEFVSFESTVHMPNSEL